MDRATACEAVDSGSIPDERSGLFLLRYFRVINY